MNETNQVFARSFFTNWLTATRNPNNAFWELGIEWDSQDFLEHLVQCLASDIAAYGASLPEEFSIFGSLVIADLTTLEEELENDDAAIVITFIRYVVSGAALRIAIMNGRPSLVYNWLLCSATCGT